MPLANKLAANGAIIKPMRAVVLMAIWVVVAMVVLLVPGFAIIAVKVRRHPNGAKSDMAPVIVTASLVHLAAFFIWYQSPTLGKLYTFVTLGLSVVALAQTRSRSLFSTWLSDRNITTPLMMAAGLSMVVLGSLLLHGGGAHPPDVAAGRWLRNLPPDNVLPLLLAERLVDHSPVEPFFDGWQSSDRPPLQAGAFVFVEPLRFGLAFNQLYQVVSTVLASFWLIALWTFLRRLRVDRSSISIAILTVSASGTIVFNMGYVWPKLLSATLALMALSLVVRDSNDRVLGLTRWLLCGSAGALSLLAHGAGMYALAPCLLVLPIALLMGRAQWKPIVLALTAAAATLLPWIVYQRLVAPPGDRLLAWHLGGVVEDRPDAWHVSMIDHYQEIGWKGAVANRRSNFSVLVDVPNVLADTFGLRSLEQIRASDFYRLGNALGVAWLSLLIAIALVVRRSRSRRPFATSGWLLTGAGWGIIVWCLLAFGPAAATPHQGTAVVPLLMMSSASLIASQFDRRLGWLLAFGAVIRVSVIWLAAPDPRRPELSSSAIGLLALGACIVAASLIDVVRHPDRTIGPDLVR